MAMIDRAAILIELGTGRAHRLADVCTIGRDRHNLVVLDDPSVSSFHAEVVRTAHGRILLRDLCTRGGTRVGGERVVERFLADGDLVAFGATWLRYQQRPAPPLASRRRRAIEVSSAPPA